MRSVNGVGTRTNILRGRGEMDGDKTSVEGMNFLEASTSDFGATIVGLSGRDLLRPTALSRSSHGGCDEGVDVSRQLSTETALRVVDAVEGESKLPTRKPCGETGKGRGRGVSRSTRQTRREGGLPSVAWKKKSKRTTPMRQPKNTRRKEIEALKWGVKKRRDTPRRKTSTEQLNSIHERLQTDATALVDTYAFQTDSELTDSGASQNPPPRTQSGRSRRTLLASLAEDSDEGEQGIDRRGGDGIADKAISKSGYTCRGRVKQKAQKRVELIRVGERVVSDKWYNAGCIFPLGYKSRTRFRSSVDLDGFCVHECEIVKGEFWPNPTFVITAHDRPDEKLVASSCTGCWTLVLKRINNEIVRRRRAGEKRPPPPKTAIAGPEYFGLSQQMVMRRIEALDKDKQCVSYWAGKQDRQMAARNLHLLPSYKTESNGGQSRPKNRGQESDSDEEEDDVTRDGTEEEDGCYTLSKWSALCRLDRYKKRCMSRGSLPDSAADDDNPLPELIDLITLQSVVTPAISPYGHVLGIATWRACLSEHRVCPFTRNPLSIEQCTVLTKNNIDKYRHKIANA